MGRNRSSPHLLRSLAEPCSFSRSYSNVYTYHEAGPLEEVPRIGLTVSDLIKEPQNSILRAERYTGYSLHRVKRSLLYITDPVTVMHINTK